MGRKRRTKGAGGRGWLGRGGSQARMEPSYGGNGREGDGRRRGMRMEVRMETRMEVRMEVRMEDEDAGMKKTRPRENQKEERSKHTDEPAYGTRRDTTWGTPARERQKRQKKQKKQNLEEAGEALRVWGGKYYESDLLHRPRRRRCCLRFLQGHDAGPIADSSTFQPAATMQQQQHQKQQRASASTSASSAAPTPGIILDGRLLSPHELRLLKGSKGSY
ncbi:predicted protein [Histoplasma capsulatum G186AR]|uniref:Uncharacterized protein n=1 Tax=Ajellomyces capsulatus (strain G186AR / H82 / ATCC MYA-2454 / RMSCC 2432) TaxID=447093 RepID=C0NIF8_AJECG|nr:uncharacterized protein HCBG_02215 [Histoplasma capsulatum G186AR]EEH08678.1 predicted protein [Histoplasma capsulatum G186AR]